MISSSNNKSEINKCDEEMLLQNNTLNKIEEKEDNKEESNKTGTIGQPLSNRIEEEKQEEGEENSNPKKTKSSISSASDDEEKKNNNNDNIDNEEKNNENINIQGNEKKEDELIGEEKPDKKSSGESYGLLGNDNKKSSDKGKNSNKAD